MIDFDEKEEINRVEQELADLDRQVNEMDVTLRDYLTDPKRYPPPQQQRLIDRIRSYRIHHLGSSHLELLLENLQWKLFYHEKSWNQWREDSENRKANERRSERHYCAPDNEEFKSKKTSSVEMLWEIQQDKLKEHQINEPSESKEEFKQRLIHTYRQLVKEKTENQKMVLVFEKKHKRCSLKLERRNYHH
jgi:hypothetical protein